MPKQRDQRSVPIDYTVHGPRGGANRGGTSLVTSGYRRIDFGTPEFAKCCRCGGRAVRFGRERWRHVKRGTAHQVQLGTN